MAEENEARSTEIVIDVGTAYDFFISLQVLHEPKKFGVRGAWASGMLARLTAESRATLAGVREHRDEYLEKALALIDDLR